MPRRRTAGAAGRAAEFFAGIGLVRMALERAGWSVQYANDIKPFKRDMYCANFPGGEFDLRDIRKVSGADIPDVDLATASFPCIDLSLAGWRRGLAGEHSGLFWEFARVIGEMGERRPQLLLIENVPSFLTSAGGADLRAAISRLNSLGYECDLLIADAQWYVPQSRKRLFIAARVGGLADSGARWEDSPLRPPALARFIDGNPDLGLVPLRLSSPPADRQSLDSVVERLDDSDERWWEPKRVRMFVASLAERHRERMRLMLDSRSTEWATAYRRTRNGRAVWEIRADGIAGCLRTAAGGSSRQALLETARGIARVRWMTPLEYARLQGAEGYRVPESVSDNQALSGFGDAVCVPALEWIVRECLNPLAEPSISPPADSSSELAAAGTLSGD